jgi:hypothetical protein
VDADELSDLEVERRAHLEEVVRRDPVAALDALEGADRDADLIGELLLLPAAGATPGSDVAADLLPPDVGIAQ